MLYDFHAGGIKNSSEVYQGLISGNNSHGGTEHLISRSPAASHLRLGSLGKGFVLVVQYLFCMQNIPNTIPPTFTLKDHAIDDVKDLQMRSYRDCCLSK